VHVLGNWLLVPGAQSADGCRHHVESASAARVAFGFRSPEALIALAMLSLGGLYPPLPGRA
jgi:hypothetical protein